MATFITPGPYDRVWDHRHRDAVRWLGHYVQTHHIGDYEIIEYIPKESAADPTTPEYAVRVSGVDIGRVAASLDHALLIGMGYKYLGSNAQFSIYAARMLEMKDN